MKKKYYAVKKGKETGIFNTWNECKKAVEGYSGAVYKSFEKFEDAQSYMEQDTSGNLYCNFSELTEEELKNDEKKVTAFVDGSYDSETNYFSYGLVALGMGIIYQDCMKDNEPMIKDMKNVAGEIMGAQTAMEYCIGNDIKKLDLFYDYEGIAQWALKGWQCKTFGTRRYAEYYDSIKDKLEVRFYKVQSHSGIKYNEMADKLAKKALMEDN